MVTKSKKKTSEPEKPNPAQLDIDSRYMKPGELDRMKGADKDGITAFEERLTARAISQPEVRASAIIQEFHGESLNVNAMVNELREQVAEVQRGDMKRPEAMLVAQAHALDALFCSLARRSHANSNAGYLDAAERYLRLALKAQSQCRTTVEALAEIKNPRPVAFVKQANIAHGPQQVNNGVSAARAGEIANPSNELLEAQHGNYLDACAAGAAIGVNSELATVAEVNRAAH